MGKDPMRSTHMNIQQKILWIAAYGGFVHNTEIENIDQYIEQKLLLVNDNDVKGYPMLFLHITNKNTKKQWEY